MQKAV
ncbi:short chain dehydrogenase family protein, partial [Yersinia pestis PY-95]